MKYFLKISLFVPFIFCYFLVHRIDKGENHLYGSKPACRIMFWNPENLFDTFNDSLTGDDEFLPYGIRHWTPERYRKKLIHVYQTILAAGYDGPPEIIGLCEIENKTVLFNLIRETPFRHFRYKFVHYESPDRRGIDVAMLYNPEYIKVIEEAVFPVDLSDERGDRGRDILYVRAALKSVDTISLFINHWPSKYGGAGITESYRMKAAGILRRSINDLLLRFPDEQIVIMGDFNDPPESNSVSIHLNCRTPGKMIRNDMLYNLTTNAGSKVFGTYKYQGIWEMLDQFIVSGNLLLNEKGMKTGMDKFKIFAPQFLLEHDEVYGGEKPYRTYNGMKYQPGFSDHLPVYIDMEYSGR